MSTGFSRTLRSLRSDNRSLSIAAILLAGCLVTAWFVWACFARVTLYEITNSARFEVARAAYPIQSPLAGRVLASYLSVNREVKAGEVLVELDASPERLQLREEQARMAALKPELDALRRQAEAEERARNDERQAATAAADEARADARQAEAPARYAQLEEQRLNDLRSSGLIPERELERGRADAQQAQAAVERQRLAIFRLQQEQRTRASERDARMRRLEADITHLEGQISTGRAVTERLKNETERRSIRAPVSGTIGEAAVLRAGSFVDEGDHIGAILPSGKLLVIAQFPPPAALGRIKPGQLAQIRLEGFPWMQYGTVRARVAHVAGEVRDGTVRVELAVDSGRPTEIPLQHGLPGSVEIEVERVAPISLVMRHAGQMLSAPRSAFSSKASRS
ncbi:MAG: HlyD family secretion protein [Bryobacteraceae bacterium]